MEYDGHKLIRDVGVEMATNMALKRARKAQRRKQVVAEKRKLEVFASSLEGTVRRAAALPIQHCLLTEAIFENGLGILVVARGLTPGHVGMATFLIDVFCLGVKDVTFKWIGAEEFAFHVEKLGGASPLVPVDPSYGRKLLRDAVAWSQSKGFPPHRDFAVAAPMLADVNPDNCDEIFRFGRDGKPFYMPGPKESISLMHRRLEQAVAARLLEDESAREAAEIDDASDSTDPLGLLRAG
jgi:hypothetical protein